MGAGDLICLHNGWYVTHTGLIGLARRKRCSGIHVEAVDVLGQDTGFADLAAAIGGYRKSLDLDARTTALDPNSMRARPGLANMQMKIGNAELDIDAAQALRDFQLALQRFDALPESERRICSLLEIEERVGHTGENAESHHEMNFSCS